MASPWLLADQQRRRAAQAEELARLTQPSGLAGQSFGYAQQNNPIPNEQSAYDRFVQENQVTPPARAVPDSPNVQAARKAVASYGVPWKEAAETGAHAMQQVFEPVSGAVMGVQGQIEGDQQKIDAAKKSLFMGGQGPNASELAMQRTMGAVDLDPNEPAASRAATTAIKTPWEALPLVIGPGEVLSGGRMLAKPTNAMARRVHQAILSRAKEAGRGETLFSLGPVDAARLQEIKEKLPTLTTGSNEYRNLKAEQRALSQKSIADDLEQASMERYSRRAEEFGPEQYVSDMKIGGGEDATAGLTRPEPTRKRSGRVTGGSDDAQKIIMRIDQLTSEGKFKREYKNAISKAIDDLGLQEGNEVLADLRARLADYPANKGEWKIIQARKAKASAEPIIEGQFEYPPEPVLPSLSGGNPKYNEPKTQQSQNVKPVRQHKTPDVGSQISQAQDIQNRLDAITDDVLAKGGKIGDEDYIPEYQRLLKQRIALDADVYRTWHEQIVDNSRIDPVRAQRALDAVSIHAPKPNSAVESYFASEYGPKAFSAEQHKTLEKLYNALSPEGSGVATFDVSGTAENPGLLARLDDGGRLNADTLRDVEKVYNATALAYGKDRINLQGLIAKAEQKSQTVRPAALTVEPVPREPVISPETQAEFKAAAEKAGNPEYADKVLAKAEELAPDKIAGQNPEPTVPPSEPPVPPADIPLAGEPPRRGPAPVGKYAEHTGTREPVPEVPLMGADPVKPGWFRRTRSGVAFLRNLVGKALSSTNILEDAVRQRIPEHIPPKVAAKARQAAPEFRQRILGVGTESAATSDPQVGKLTQWRDALPDKDAAALTAMHQPEGRSYRVAAWSADNQHISSLPPDLKAKSAPIDEWIDASGKAQSDAGLAQRVMVEKPDKAMQALMDADPEAAEALAEEVGTRYVAAPQPFRPSHRAPRVTDPTLAETERLNPQGDVARAKWKAVEEINWDNDPRYNPDLLPEEVRPQGKELTDARRKGRAKLRAKIKAAIGEAQTRSSSAAESMSPLEFERDFYFWPDQFLHNGQWHDATVWRLAKKGGKELSYLEVAPQRVAHRIAMDKAFGQDLGVLDKELTEQYLAANATVPNIRHEGGNVYNDYLDVFQKAGMDSTDFDRVIAAMEHRPRTVKGDPTGYMAGMLDRARIASTSNAQAAQTAQEFGKDLFALVAHRVTGVGSSIGNLWQGMMAGTGMLSKAGRSPLRVFSDAIKAIPEAAKAEELMGRGLSVNTLERGIGDVETATNTYVKTGSLEQIKQVADRVTLRRYFQRIGQQRSLRQAKGRFEGLEALAKKGQLGTQEEALRRTFGLPDTWIQAMEELPKLEGTPEYLITKAELEDRFIAANVRQTQLIGQQPYMKRRAQLGAFGEQIASFAGPTLQNFSRWQEAVQQLWRSGGKSGWRRVGAKAAGATLGAVGFEVTREVFNAAYNMIANKDSQAMKPGTSGWTQRVFAKMLFDLGALGGVTDVIEQYSSHKRGTVGDTVRGLGTPTALEFAGQAVDSLSHSQKVGLVENVMKKAMIPYIVGKDVAGVGSWAVILSGLISKAAQKVKQDEKAKVEEKPAPKQMIAPSPIDLKLEELFNNEDVDAKLERIFGEQDIDSKLLELMK